MTNSKSTKRALLTSALAMLMCVAMLIGTTFAWFTDTASTSVNKIESGTLDIDLEMKNPNYTGVDDTTHDEWISAVGNTLSFRDVNGSDDILWEPGATFNLDSFRIVNNGNLALKYKVVVTGITGDAKLMEAINFTVKDGEASAIDLAAWEGGILLPEGEEATEGTTEVVGHTDAIVLSGHMDEDAGNEYQGLSVGAISITVYATQYTYENDSTDDTYDEEAYYPYVLVTSSGETTHYTDFAAAMANIQDGDTLKFNQTTDKTLVYKTTAATPLNNITFAAADGVTLHGLQLISESTNTKLTLSNITFKNIGFTNQVVLGQTDSTNGYSQCSDITFDECTFDMSASGLEHKDAIYNNVWLSGSSTNEQIANSFLTNLTVKNCTFRNCENALELNNVCNLVIEDCKFNDIEDYAVNVHNLVGTGCAMRRNTADNVMGMLQINTVGNNYVTPYNATKLALIKNIVTNATVEDTRYVFHTSYDNVNYDSTTQSSKSGYSWPGMQSFANKINGSTNVAFSITASDYGPSHQEVIWQPYGDHTPTT